MALRKVCSACLKRPLMCACSKPSYIQRDVPEARDLTMTIHKQNFKGLCEGCGQEHIAGINDIEVLSDERHIFRSFLCKNCQGMLSKMFGGSAIGMLDDVIPGERPNSPIRGRMR